MRNLTTLIKKRHEIIIKMKLLYYKMESTVDSYEKETLYICRYPCVDLYVYVCMCIHKLPSILILYLRTSGRCNRQAEFALLHFTIFH